MVLHLGLRLNLVVVWEQQPLSFPTSAFAEGFVAVEVVRNPALGLRLLPASSVILNHNLFLASALRHWRLLPAFPATLATALLAAFLAALVLSADCGTLNHQLVTLAFCHCFLLKESGPSHFWT